jgi:GTP-binding protein
MKSLSRVLVVGQPNVGKSVLFNRLTKTRQAITSHIAHTTRDHNRGVVSHQNTSFELVDSAGYGKTSDELNKLAISQLEGDMNSTDLILFIADGTQELNDNDLKLAKLALKSKKPVVLAANKNDKGSFIKDANYFRRLGFEQTFAISAINGTGIVALLDYITSNIPRKKASSEPSEIKIAILGRPNVGKSALINALAKEDLALVSDIAGTTRDVNAARVSYKKQILAFLDTAGLRRRGKIERNIEFFSAQRTKQAIEEADICLVLIDATQMLRNQDEHIIGMVKDAKKPLITVVSKWDAREEKDEKTMAVLADQLSGQLQYVWWAPLIFTSAQTGQNLEKLKQLIVDIHAKQAKKLPTTKLNKVLREAVAKQPPVTTKSYHAKLNYITQTDDSPLTLSIFGTHPEVIHFSYSRYLENQIRDTFDLTGIPIKIEFKSKYKD